MAVQNQEFQTRSIFAKRNSVYILPLAITWVVFCGLFAYSSYQSYLLETAQAKATADNTNRLIEAYIQGLYGGVDVSLRDLIFEINEGTGLSQKTHEKFFALVARRSAIIPDLLRTRFVDEQGKFLGPDFKGGNPTTDFRSVEDRDYFQKHKIDPNAGLVVSKPFHSRITGVWQVTLSRRINKKDGSFGGILFAVVQVKAIESFIKDFDVGVHGSISIFTADDYSLIARSPVMPELNGKAVKNSAIFAKYKNEGLKEGFLKMNSVLDGVTRINKFRVNEKLNLIVVASVAEVDYLASWNRQIWFGGGILGVLASIFMTLLVFFLRAQNQLEIRNIQMVGVEKMAALGEMAGGIAHEINNPLSIILGKVQQSIRKIGQGKGSLPELEISLRQTEETALRIAKIVRGLSSFSRDAEEDPFVASKIKDIVQDTFGVCHEKFKIAGVDLKFQDNLPDGTAIMCRPSQISQVILNMLNNAFDATEGQQSRWVKVEASLNGEKIVLAITDSGQGIPANIAAKIMEPFFTTKEVGKGTGLGLSISKGIVELHHGSLYLNEKSQNTSFVIEFPQTKAA